MLWIDTENTNKKIIEIRDFKDDLIMKFKDTVDVSVESIIETIKIMERSLEKYHLVKI